jgi:RNA ligase
MKISIDELQKRSKYINCNEHDTLPICIWNYTHNCQYERAWDAYTMSSRGLITDRLGNILARPFKKFFNIDETEETKLGALPLEVPAIYEKLDGSLGIQYYDGNTVCIATRGSFNSEQAVWATDWIQERFKRSDFKEGYTYLYEILYRENRIVIDYSDREELVLLAVVNNEDGSEIDLEEESKRLKLSIPKIINTSISSIIESLKTLSGNEEGFVLKYSNGLRVKMKGDEYVRLHRLITGFSTKSIWECLKNGDDINELIEKVPDEFYSWVKKKEKELNDKFDEIWNVAVSDNIRVSPLNTRKEKAIWLQNNSKLMSVVFSLIDNETKKAEQQVWKMLKPEYELPFREQKEDI